MSIILDRKGGSGQRSPRARLGIACLVLFGASALVLQSAAAHHEKQGTMIREQTARFALSGTHGYRVLVTAETASKGLQCIGICNSLVTLSAVHGSLPHGAEVVTYTTQRAGHSTTIHASFGRFGAIAVRFIPSGKLLRARVPSCSGGSRGSVVKTRLGVFVGTIRFHGEGGYTAAHATRARGGVGDFDGPLRAGQRLPCESPIKVLGHSKESSVAKPVHLDVEARRRHIGFRVSPYPASPPVPSPQTYEFEGFANELRGRLMIARSTSALGPASDFAFDSSFRSATVTPPPPFTGTATFQRADHSTSWTGSLGGPLPGRGAVHLAGRGFTGELRAGPRRPIGG